MNDPTQDLRRSSDPLTKALLPVLVHEVKGATQLLVGLRSILDVPGGEALFERRAPDLAHTSERMHDLGFVMAVLSTASGADMLMARREASGLRILVDLARRAAGFSGGSTPQMGGEPPLIAASALDGWQVPWAGGALVGLCAGFTWRWDGPGRLIGERVAECQAPPGLLELVRERTPGATLEVGADGTLAWELPSAWLM